MAKSTGKVTIKKYANRRLYDTESSTYITLDRLAAMVREGREFEVVDAKTGDDITRQVLTQIIVDEEARGATMLPLNFLKQLIGLYGNSCRISCHPISKPRWTPSSATRARSRTRSAATCSPTSPSATWRCSRAPRRPFRQAQARGEAEQQRRRPIESRACRAPGQSRPTEPLIAMFLRLLQRLR